MRVIVIVLAMVSLAYVGLCVALFAFQRSMIYFPSPRSSTGAATTTLKVDGVDVLVTTRPHDGPDAALYFGGNAEDVASSLSAMVAAFPGHAIYLMHYRGYGGSGGAPSETAIVADALALFDTVHDEHASIVVVGRSLGSGVAVHLASERPVARLVLVTPFSSLQDVASRHYPWFPVRWLLRDKFESWRYATKVSAPTTLIAAELDEIIPRASTEELLTRFGPGVATLSVLPGVGHNTVSESPEYIARLRGVP